MLWTVHAVVAILHAEQALEGDIWKQILHATLIGFRGATGFYSVSHAL